MHFSQGEIRTTFKGVTDLEVRGGVKSDASQPLVGGLPLNLAFLLCTVLEVLLWNKIQQQVALLYNKSS